MINPAALNCITTNEADQSSLVIVESLSHAQAASPLNELSVNNRSIEEIAELKRRIAFIFGVSSGEFDFEILPHPENWACGFSPEASQALDQLIKGDHKAGTKLPDEAFQPNAFYYHTTEIMTRPEDQIAGITHHEAAHAQFTNYRVFIEGVYGASQQGSIQSAWADIFNGLEDGRINRLKSGSSLAGHKYLSDLYAAWVEDVTKLITTQPLLKQFSLNCVHRWATGRDIEQIRDTRVRALIDATRNDVDRYIQSDDAITAAQIINQSIWPQANKLLEDDIQEQVLKDLHSEQQNSLWGRIKRFFKKLCGGGSNDGEISDKERSKLEKSFKKFSDDERNSRSQRAKETIDQLLAEGHNRDGLKGFRFDKDEESGEYRVLRIKAPDSAEIPVLRDAFTEALRDAQQEKLQMEADDAQKQREERRRMQAGFAASENEEYSVFRLDYEAVAPILERFTDNLKRVLPHDAERLLEGEYLSGPHLNKRLLSRRAPISDGRFFQRRLSITSNEPLVDLTLLIDNSGSMEGEKIVSARRTALLIMHACERLAVPCSIRIFAHTDQVAKTREQSVNRPSDRVHYNLIEALNGAGGGTNIGTPLSKEHHEVRRFRRMNPKTQCAVFVVSDSGANEGAVESELERIINNLRSDAIVVNFILSGEEKDIANCKRVFGLRNVIEAPDVNSLTHKMVGSLTRIFFEVAQRRS